MTDFFDVAERTVKLWMINLGLAKDKDFDLMGDEGTIPMPLPDEENGHLKLFYQICDYKDVSNLGKYEKNQEVIKVGHEMLNALKGIWHAISNTDKVGKHHHVCIDTNTMTAWAAPKKQDPETLAKMSKMPRLKITYTFVPEPLKKMIAVTKKIEIDRIMDDIYT